MPDFYPNLPGVVVDLVEQKKTIPVAQPGGLTQSLLILGTATDGPLYTPISYANPNDAEAVFGKIEPDGSGKPTLTRSAYEAYLAGARDIRLMKVTGAYARSDALSCGPVPRMRRVNCTEDLGLCSGNAETVVQCVVTAAQDQVESVEVTAGGRPVSKAFYEQSAVAQQADTPDVYAFTVTIGEGATDRGVNIVVSYVYKTAGQAASITQSIVCVAAGGSQEFTLTHQPIGYTFALYADGRPVAADAYSFDTTTPTKMILKPGYCVRGSQMSCTYSYEEQADYTASIKLRSTGAAALYNDVTIKVDGIYQSGLDVPIAKKLIITKPASKQLFTNEPPLEYNTIDYPTFAAIVNAINNDPRNNIVVADTDDPAELSYDLPLIPSAVNLQGGDDGLHYSRAQIYEALGGIRDSDGVVVKEGAYTLLENYAVDHVVLTGVYADDIENDTDSHNFAEQLAQFCAVSSMLNNNVLGYIGVRPIMNPTLSEISGRVRSLINMPHQYYMRNIKGEYMRDNDGNLIPIGKYISICSYPDFIIEHPRIGRYVADPAVYYAALAAALPGDAGTTYVQLPNITLRYELSSPLRDKLVGAQYVTFENSSKRPIVTVGCTAAEAGSDYDSLMTMKIVNTVTQLIRAVSEPYIGRAYSAPVRAAHTQAVQNALSGLVSRGTLADFEFNIALDRSSRNTKRAIVNLMLVTAVELRKVHLFVNLTPDLT
ncbi:MAG TPA: hypothetical protein GX530_10275 [Corynebacteriales bacterium]|nr:hypothetical protein [Mycobacteriales bacterium]